MNLLIRATDDDGRYASLSGYLQTDWDILVADAEDPREWAAGLARAQALISMEWNVGMPPAPGLRLIHLPGAGTDLIDATALPPSTSVCNAYEHEVGIAEYVLAAMLEWVVGLRKLDEAIRRDHWYGSWMCGPLHGELFGRTLGIVGYGRIGREAAKRAAAFGMRTLAVSRTAGRGDEWVETVEPMSALLAMLGRSDFVLVALPLDAATRGVIDAAAIAAMRSNGVLINVCRGPVIDEDALYEALRSRHIGGAVIDTWYNYPKRGECDAPPANHPFRELDNVIMSGHASAWTENLMPRRCRVIATNLDRLARGEPLVNIVYPARHTP